MAQTATQAYVNEKIVEVNTGGTVDLTHKADVVYVDDKLAQLTLNVRDFGAKGDGETDDSDSLQRAFDAGEGSKVLIPRGTYKITKTIYVHSNTIVEGVGENSVVVLGNDYELAPIVSEAI